MYDGDGNRVSKIVNGVTTQFLVDDLNPTGYPQVVEELTSGAVSRTYTYGLQRISENQVISSTWTPSFYGYDGFGTVRQLTNSVGTITDTYDYDAFGNEVHSTGSTPNSYLYRGEQFDTDLGLYYLRARYYNPTTGRFMGRDPEDGVTTDPASLHKYLYAEGDPTNHLDRSGRDTSQEEASITIAVPENPAVIAGEIAEAAAVTCVLNKAATTLEGFTTDLGSPITKVINLPCATKVEHECRPGVVYRIYGGRSPLWGASWTYTPPGEVPNWYIAAGVGGWNTKLNIAVGDLVNPEGCTCGQAKGAYDLDGTWLSGNGTDEVSCPNPQSHINLLATGKTGKGFGRD